MTALWLGADTVSRWLLALLLLMSIASWVVMVWQGWRLMQARRSLPRALAAFWQAPHWSEAAARAAVFDRLQLLPPLLKALRAVPKDTVAARVSRSEQVKRRLREGLDVAHLQLHWGQVLLATIGTTAPFVGLLGTVWGIHEALVEMAQAGQLSIDQIAAPVGEALVMTAIGLAVALPAVVGYNLLGRLIARAEAQLEGFAHDLLAHQSDAMGLPEGDAVITTEAPVVGLG